MMPRVSFLMAVFNGAATVGEAVGSIMAQGFSDFELLVVDDGSTDESAEIVRGMGDERVRVVSCGRNLGLSGALNFGLSQVRGELVARMDADDVCLPQRAAVQVKFLEQHPQVGVVGSFVETFSEHGARDVVKYPTAAELVGATMLFRSALAHPAVMFRRSALAGLQYEPDFRYAQDYALWLECVKKGILLANVDEVLLRYRLHGGQLSASMEKMQGEGTVIRSRFLRWFVDGVGEEELKLHDAVARNFLVAEAEWVKDAVGWLEKLAQVNERRGVFERDGFLRVLTGRYVAVVRFARERGTTVGGVLKVFAPFVRPGALG
jgi:hypothetical protein